MCGEVLCRLTGVRRSWEAGGRGCIFRRVGGWAVVS
eukprot:gene19231-38489_t